jgi:hypothetical protein
MCLKEKIQVFLNQKGQFKCPNGVQRKVAKTGQGSPKAAKVVAERYVQVVENLQQRGIAKPRTIAKLEGTIAALFQNKLRPAEVNALVQELLSRRVIAVAGSKVTYRWQRIKGSWGATLHKVELTERVYVPLLMSATLIKESESNDEEVDVGDHPGIDVCSGLECAGVKLRESYVGVQGDHELWSLYDQSSDKHSRVEQGWCRGLGVVDDPFWRVSEAGLWSVQNRLFFQTG